MHNERAGHLQREAIDVAVIGRVVADVEDDEIEAQQQVGEERSDESFG